MQLTTSKPLSNTSRAMGTDMTLSLWPDAGRERAAASAVRHEMTFLRRAERRLSRFLPDSEISRLNRTSGTPVPLSQLACDAIEAALAAAEATGGLFDPSVHEAVIAAGYDRSFDTIPSTPAADSSALVARAAAPSCGRFREVTLDARARSVTLPAGMKLDLGGIAKGWLADRIARRLGCCGAALADLGGDIAVAGLPPGETAWRIGLVSDDGGSNLLGQISLVSGGVATSGVTRRRWRTAAGLQHHLIDPRTGLPALTDLLSATVTAPNTMAGEAAAKAVILRGAEAGATALERIQELGGVLVLSNGTVRTAGAVTWLPAAPADPTGGYAS